MCEHTSALPSLPAPRQVINAVTLEHRSLAISPTWPPEIQARVWGVREGQLGRVQRWQEGTCINVQGSHLASASL